jgi:hypothetical protein
VERYLRLNTLYRGVATCDPNQGDTIGFWEDVINGAINSEKFAHLLGFARNPSISLWHMRQADNLLGLFRIPMSRAAYNEFFDLPSC